MFPSGGDGIHLIVDEQSTFQPANFQRATSAIKPKARTRGPKGGGGKGKGGQKQEAGPSDIFKLVRMVVERAYSPLIVFAFGKKSGWTGPPTLRTPHSPPWAMEQLGARRRTPERRLGGLEARGGQQPASGRPKR
jgi:hypothetical protein